MKARAPANHQSRLRWEARLHHRQALIVPLPRHTRVVVTEGAVHLVLIDSSLHWPGDAAPAVRITLSDGETYVVEHGCHATLQGAQAGMTVLHFEAPAAPPLLARLRALAVRCVSTARAGAIWRRVR